MTISALKEIEMQFCQILRLCAVLMTKADKKVVILMMDDIEVNNKKITASDQYKFIKIMKDTTNVKETKQMLKKLDQLPSSIYNLVKPSIDMNKVRQVALFLATLYLLSAIFNAFSLFLFNSTITHSTSLYPSSSNTFNL